MGSENSSVTTMTPELLAYHQRTLAMRSTSCVDFPAHVHLETIAQCNASCVFCPYTSLDRIGVKMEDTLIKKIVRDLQDIPRLHRFQLSPFKVNEPFIDVRIFDLLEYFQEKLPHASITLTTNATPITEKRLARLSKFTKLGYLWISFNDHRPAEYEATMGLPYQRTRERLDMIHKAKAEGRFSTRVVLSRVGDGSRDDQDFVTWVKQNYPLFEASIFPRGQWLGQVDIQTNFPVPVVACTRWYDISITATGVVAHCCMDGKAEYPIGNVRERHVLDIYNDPQYRRLRMTVSNRHLVDPCRRCNFL